MYLNHNTAASSLSKVSNLVQSLKQGLTCLVIWNIRRKRQIISKEYSHISSCQVPMKIEAKFCIMEAAILNIIQPVQMF